MRKIFNPKIIFLASIFFGVLFVVNKTNAVVLDHSFPRTFNYYLNWTLTEAQAKELAKWDVVVMDMEVQTRHADLLKKMRVWNPKIVLLVYITPQEIMKDANTCYSQLRREFTNGLADSWYLKNSFGARLTWWPGTYLLNVSDVNYRNYLVNFVTNKLLITGLWDGVFYDNTWDSISWFAGADIDSDNNGVADTGVDQKWQEGMKAIYNQTRNLTNNKYVIVGNGTTRAYTADLNGKLLENFGSGASWQPNMITYSKNEAGAQNPQLNLINSNTKNTGTENYRDMRFGLVSTLMKNGYYSYDYGDKNHGQLWWYDEYNADLGRPMGESVSLQNYSNYQPDVWQRDFEHGKVVLNSTGETKIVDLGGDFEKLRGTQDKITNDGAIVSELNLAGKDGQILLKTISTISDVVFKNGDFVRFLGPKGERVRNGFFVFDQKYAGGDLVAYIDIDGNGLRDTFVASRGKITAWRDDGQLLLRDYPFTAKYQGQMRVAIGELNNDGRLEIAVAPASGLSASVVLYQYDGTRMQGAVLPFDKKYKGGMSVAIGSDKDAPRLVIGSGIGKEPRVFVYDNKFKKITSWNAFDAKFFGGVSVATGNVDGLPGDEVIVGVGRGTKPMIKIFNFKGKLLYPQFQAYQTLAKSGVEVMAVDVNFDGKDEIIAESEGF